MRTLSSGWRLAALGTVLALQGCQDDARFLDINDYAPSPIFESLDFSRLEPAQKTEYWEMRVGMGDTSWVLGSGGKVPEDSLPDSLRAALGGLKSLSGFGGGCLPAYCYRYLVGVRDDGLFSVTTVGELRQFLGEVGNEVEALLLARASGYYWSNESGGNGIRAVEGGYEVIALKLVSTCAPIVEKRVVLRVEAETGAVSELRSRTWHRNEHACI